MLYNNYKCGTFGVKYHRIFKFVKAKTKMHPEIHVKLHLFINTINITFIMYLVVYKMDAISYIEQL